MARCLLHLLLVFGIVKANPLTIDFRNITEALQLGGDIITSGLNIGRSFTEKLPDRLPNPEAIFTLGKEALLGVPFELLFNAFNQMCTIELVGNNSVTKYSPDINEMGFVLITPRNENLTISLSELEILRDNPLFDENLSTILLITGWTTNLNNKHDKTISSLYNAYKARGNYNFLVVDPAKFINTLYSWSAFNSEEIGRHVGNALVNFTRFYPRKKIHLIGHSLGGQIAGAAGRQYYAQTNKLLSRITGLDPANPCFNEGEVLTGLHRGDAKFVDVIHANNGVLGIKQSVGDIDFYPNGVSVLQPGCFTVDCAHARAWEYYAETVYPGNEENFMAVRCNSIESLNEGLCRGNAIPMGYNAPKEARGNYFLKTGDSPPYGNNRHRLKNI